LGLTPARIDRLWEYVEKNQFAFSVRTDAQFLTKIQFASYAEVRQISRQAR